MEHNSAFVQHESTADFYEEIELEWDIKSQLREAIAECIAPGKFRVIISLVNSIVDWSNF